MKAALIPPIHHLDEFGDGPFHLLLAHLLTSPRYRAHYKHQRNLGAYLVLDNSAHEQGQGQDPADLLKSGFDLNAQEIVVPDVLEDAGATIEFCLAAHETWFENGAAKDMLDVYSPAFMYVPQGNSVKDWAECLVSLIRIHEYCARKYSLRRDIVIGMSKDYDVWPGGLKRLLAEYVVPQRNRLEHNGVKMHVHMLGWSRDLWNLQSIAQTYPWIRSTDSAKPFVYGINRIRLLQSVGHTPPQYPKRRKNYFDHKMNRSQAACARENAWVFRQAAEGTLR